MPRPERPIDPSGGALQAFAFELRVLRQQAGTPKYLQMQRMTGKSRTALAEAAGGDHLAKWETVEAFVSACNGDLAMWRIKWERARDEVRSSRSVAIKSDVSPPENVPAEKRESLRAASTEDNFSPGEVPQWERLHRFLPYAATAAAAALLGAVIAVIFVTWSTPSNRASPPAGVAHTTITITVQNQVASGPDSLVEDSSPAYLSTKTEPSCSRKGCKVAGTELATGASLMAVCRTNGAQMYNYNLDSVASENNPNRVASTLWYRVVLADGRAGFISEVYVVPNDRGGKDLPVCPT